MTNPTQPLREGDKLKLTADVASKGRRVPAGTHVVYVRKSIAQELDDQGQLVDLHWVSGWHMWDGMNELFHTAVALDRLEPREPRDC